MKNQIPTFQVLRSYLEARASFSGPELAFVEAMFVASSLHANEFLQRAGAVAKYSAFVAKGCLRKYDEAHDKSGLQAPH